MVAGNIVGIVHGVWCSGFGERVSGSGRMLASRRHAVQDVVDTVGGDVVVVTAMCRAVGSN